MSSTEPSIIDRMDWLELETLRFDMGSDRLSGQVDDDEGPLRQVTVGRMSILARPVTHGAFRQFIDATGFQTVAEREGNGFRRANGEYRLENDLTWRDGDQDEPVSQVAWADAVEFCRWSSTRLPTEAEWERTSRHGGLPISQFGYLEWVADYYHDSFYRNEQRVNPSGPHSGTERVCRGRASFSQRWSFLPDMSSTDLTFRVVRLNR